MKVITKPYIVYLNKTLGIYASDAHKFAAINELREGEDFDEIISETVYYSHISTGYIQDSTPVYFVRNRY